MWYITGYSIVSSRISDGRSFYVGFTVLSDFIPFSLRIFKGSYCKFCHFYFGGCYNLSWTLVVVVVAVVVVIVVVTDNRDKK